MSTYLLIHGSFQGGWIWGLVAAGLRAAGHQVHHPTLDGCAERAYTLRPDITLDTQGQEIANYLFFHDLSNVIMAGTSSGGMVAARAAEIAPERIQRLVFIDALVPLTGETVPQVNGRPPYDPRRLTYGLTDEEIPDKAFSDIEDPEVRKWAAARYTRHPRRPTEEVVDLKEFWARKWQADVLRCRRSAAPPEAHQRRTAERLGGSYTELDAGHYPMLSHTGEVIEYLLARAS